MKKVLIYIWRQLTWWRLHELREWVEAQKKEGKL